MKKKWKYKKERIIQWIMDLLKKSKSTYIKGLGNKPKKDDGDFLTKKSNLKQHFNDKRKKKCSMVQKE
jgi:hypothetical protein